MKTVTLYHNPACSKSRAALALLTERGIIPELILYLDTSLTVVLLQELLRKLGKEPRMILRSDEPEYKNLGLDNPALTHAELLAVIVAHPKLLQRPIVVVGEQAVIGRPPEAIIPLVEGH